MKTPPFHPTKLLFLALSASLVLLASCKQEEPVITPPGNGTVSLSSSPYSANSAVSIQQVGSHVVVPVSDFTFCITKIKLTDDSGAPVADGTGATSISAVLGLVDVSAADVATDWGVLDIPVGFLLSKLAVEVHLDPENCGGALHSLSYNGTQLTQDLEFQFLFSPAIQLDNNDSLQLALSDIATAIQAASDAGALNDQGITAYLESMVGSGGEI